ncbi:hypothetical protein A1507_06180 [Methylomonas koyamae]|uniref:Uncharacterized protein n=1 Tax=Methylomonas koyamae TaxID=702114 RepID=A0A177NPD9_9GAMM|nr:hypothetical protein A1507_06180 [Methylomonas koyamae]
MGRTANAGGSDDHIPQTWRTAKVRQALPEFNARCIVQAAADVQPLLLHPATSLAAIQVG